jgi:hypothetical protein
MNYLEVLTISVHYSDFLLESVYRNRSLFDRWLIITTPSDIKTRDFCWQHNLECLISNDFYSNGTSFDKARGIDRGLSQLSMRDWVLHLDADIVLPPHFRQTLSKIPLDTQCIYGIDRINVKGFERYNNLMGANFLEKFSRSFGFNVCFPGSYDIGARWADTEFGWAPCGFFQLFHHDGVIRNGNRFRRYPSSGHNDAARTDMQFAMQWDRNKRVLIPEIVALHLESDDSKTGANWNGRKTGEFRRETGDRRQETENKEYGNS